MIRRRLFLGLVGVCLISALSVTSAWAARAAWSPVGATGPTVIPPVRSETQKLFIDAEGGTFTLTARHLAATGVGSRVGASFPDTHRIVKLVTLSGAFAVGQTVESSILDQNTPTTITQVAPGMVELSRFSEVDAQLTFASYDSPETTVPLPFNASAGAVEDALEALPVVGLGNVEVSGGPGGHNAEHPYVVAFKGSLAGTDVSELTIGSSALSNGSAANHTSVQGGMGTSKLMLTALNIGEVASSGTITLRAELPSGITALSTPESAENNKIGSPVWSCGGSSASEVLCTYSGPVDPSLPIRPINVMITAAPGTQSGVVEMEVSGGGASQTATEELPLAVSAIPARPGVQSFVAGAYNAEGTFDSRAGGHPDSASAAIFVNTVRNESGKVLPAGEFRDITVELPPGFLGNPIATPECPEATPVQQCAMNTMVAVVVPVLNYGTYGLPTPVFNTQAPYGYPAKFRFEVLESENLNVVGSLRSDEDYGLNAASLNTPQLERVYGTYFTFWGDPSSSTRDPYRCRKLDPNVGCVASTSPSTAFLTNATNCAEQAVTQPVTNLNTTLWQNPAEVFRSSVDIPPVVGCDKLKFESNFTFEPTDTKADSPVSFKTSLTVPSDGLTTPSKLTTPELKDIVVTLPEGAVLNASGADGLQACSLEQIGYKGNHFPMPNPIRFNKAAQTCPDASKIGTGELKTALLTDPLKGALYLAAQGDGNPYGSLFAIYLVIEDPRHGIFIKLPGRVDPDERTGQMKVTFANLPQVPFTRLDLSLKGGNRSALASPTTCGSYVTTATATPWSAPESGPPTVSANGFDINQGPNGMPCASTPGERPFDIGWKAGADSTKAAASGPFTMQITRPDGSQELTGLNLKTPKGVSASLKGIPQCSEAQIEQAKNSTGKAEQANSACPAGAKVGTLTTGAGSGPSPFYVNGNIYLAGPYKGAPLSVVAVTPAVAGPFDLGNVVVRNAVKIDRGTAQVSATSDEIPQILKGVVLRIRDVRIKLDRKDWTINPTSCDASQVELSARGANGATANRSTRFQVGSCQDLAFGPKLSAKVTGGTKRGAHPAFTATVDFPAGQANAKDVQVTLPHSEFLDQAHINTICTRVQAAANACPQGAIYGFAEAESPLIDGKLTGPVFLKSSDHQLPDLAIALKGPDSQPVEVEFQGRIDSIKAQIRNTIEGLPDVPVTKFTLKMKGGKKGLLVNSRNLCKGKPGRLTVKMTGQNNKSSSARPRLGNSCKGAPKKKAKKGKAKRTAGRSSLGALASAW